MSSALDVVTCWAVAPGAVLAPAVNVAAGDTLTVRAFDPAKKAYLLNVWTFQNAAGQVRITAPPFMHDSVDNIRLATRSFGDGFPNSPEPLLPFRRIQEVKSKSNILVELSGSGAVGDTEIALLLLWYEDLPGVFARYIDPATLDAYAVDYMTVGDATGAIITTGTPNYGPATLLNTLSVPGMFKKNKDYALIGYGVRTVGPTVFDIGAITLRGADTGGLRIAMPGVPMNLALTGSWFVLLSNAYGLPLIPVFNQRNIGGTVLEVVGNQFAAETVTVSLTFAELR